MNKKAKISIVIICGLAVVMWSYYFPYQERLCKKAYNEYRERQGIAEDDILEFDAHKIYNVDGWEIIVKYKTDPLNTYYYKFFRSSLYGTTVTGGKMSLFVYDSMSNDARYHCLFPPLPEY